MTRINNKFKNQKELRIVLAGRNILNTDEQVFGYKVEIKPEAINTIYIYPNTEKPFVEKLEQLDGISSKLVYL